LLTSVDDEAKAAFREALDAHTVGMYRCVCRLLFPEIERVARLEIYDGRVGKRMTSQHDLRKLAGRLTPGALEPIGFLNLNLFKKLQGHLYDDIKTEEHRVRCEADAVPNRHAALHGFVVYATMQNSLNTIFMTDYILQIIDYYKRRAEVELATESH
jgi:hypothetical protein